MRFSEEGVGNMRLFDKRLILSLLIIDAIFIIIAMVSGPLDYTSVSMGASISAIIISVAVICYGFFSWKKR